MPSAKEDVMRSDRKRLGRLPCSQLDKSDGCGEPSLPPGVPAGGGRMTIFLGQHYKARRA